jgi:hypothetical protein
MKKMQNYSKSLCYAPGLVPLIHCLQGSQAAAAASWVEGGIVPRFFFFFLFFSA